MERRKFYIAFGLGLVLVLVLVLLYLVRPGLHPSVGGTGTKVMELESTENTSWQDMMLAGSVLQHRLRLLSAQTAGLVEWKLDGERLVLSVPACVSSDWIAAEASRVGRVELVDGGTQYLSLGSVVKTDYEAHPDQGVYQAVLTPAHFVSAEAYKGDEGKPSIDFVLTPAGDSRLNAHTAQQRGYYLCLTVDDLVVDCPILSTPLVDRRGSMQLSDEATLDDARVLAALLSSGPLPSPLRLAGN